LIDILGIGGTFFHNGCVLCGGTEGYGGGYFELDLKQILGFLVTSFFDELQFDKFFVFDFGPGFRLHLVLDKHFTVAKFFWSDSVFNGITLLVPLTFTLMFFLDFGHGLHFTFNFLELLSDFELLKVVSSIFVSVVGFVIDVSGIMID